MKDKRDYILKITNATGIELVVISYDLLLEHIEDAMESCGSNPAAFIDSVNKARDVLMELIGALNMDYQVSREIHRLYMRVNTLFMSALCYEKKNKLDEARRILDILREGWVKVRDSEPKSDKLYANAPVVYAGLTYNRNGADDYMVSNPSRGIKA